jgi:hypothetical protein
MRDTMHMQAHAGRSEPHCIEEDSTQSKVKAVTALVPTTSPTVTLVYAGLRLLAGPPIRHWAVVTEVHAEVVHCASRIATAVGVKP